MPPRARTLAILGLLALAAFSAGCRSRRVVRGVVTGGGERQGNAVQVGGGGEVAHGTPREQLEQLDRALRAQNYQPVGPATHAELPPNGITAYQIDVRRGHCYVLALFGAAGSDANLVMLDPAGRDIGHDVRPDGHPWVGFCAARGGRFVARVQMAGAQGGDYFFAPYFAAGRRPVDLTAFFGAAEQGPQVAQLDGETQQRLAALDASLGGERFQRVGEPNGLVLRNREERLFQLALEQGRCYVFASFGGAGATDTNVALSDGSGQRLESDARSERDGTIRYCAPATGNYALHVNMYGGEGPLFTVAYAQASAQASPTEEPAEPVIAETSTAAAGLAETFALLDADMRARGYEVLAAPQDAELAEGAEQTIALELQGTQCYAALITGDAGVRSVTLSLRDPAGREVDRDESGDARGSVRACPQTPGRYSAVVRMTSGGGHLKFGSYHWPRGYGLGDVTGMLYVRLAEVTALLGVEGFAPDPGYSTEHGRMRREGATATHRLELQPGQCYSVVVVGGEGIRDLDVSLMQGSSQVATDFGAHNAFPSVRHCPTAAGAFQINVRAGAGAGDYVYQVFSQASATPDT